MPERLADGSAGDADYGKIGHNYSVYRRPDPRIAALIHRCLANASNILNIGAGAGAYEPVDQPVVALEPSASMRAQRPSHLAPAIDAVAERIPFAEDYFDAAMATFTVHQWPDLQAGLREMRRVTRGRIVIMTCDPAELDRFWLYAYAPEVVRTEAKRYPFLSSVTAALGGRCEVIPVPIPLDCTDGFNEAYYGRPERLLEEPARQVCSAWSLVDPAVVVRFEDHLRRDLAEGTWDAAHGQLRRQSEFIGSLKILIAEAV